MSSSEKEMTQLGYRQSSWRQFALVLQKSKSLDELLRSVFRSLLRLEFQLRKSDDICTIATSTAPISTEDGVTAATMDAIYIQRNVGIYSINIALMISVFLLLFCYCFDTMSRTRKMCGHQGHSCSDRT